MFWSTFIFILTLDQISKLLASQFLSISINQGLSFSWQWGIPTQLLTGVLCCLVVVIFFLGKAWWVRYPFLSALFWAGIISNLIDRLFLGGVVDWWFHPWFNFSNNLADISLAIGAIGLGWQVGAKKLQKIL